MVGQGSSLFLASGVPLAKAQHLVVVLDALVDGDGVLGTLLDVVLSTARGVALGESPEEIVVVLHPAQHHESSGVDEKKRT